MSRLYIVFKKNVIQVWHCILMECFWWRHSNDKV